VVILLSVSLSVSAFYFMSSLCVVCLLLVVEWDVKPLLTDSLLLVVRDGLLFYFAHIYVYK